MRRPAVLVLLLASCTTPEPTAVDGSGARPAEEVGIPPIGGGVNPSLAWSTYVGTPAFDMVRDVAVDPQGDVYAAGGTRGAGLATRAGGFQRAFPGNSDAFVMKFSPVGGLLWTTYLGGSAYDRAYAVEIAPDGDVVVAGRAGAGFPVTAGAFQTAFRGGSLPNGAYGPQDGFVCRLTPIGQRRWCSYFGTPDYNVIRDVAVDANGDIYVAASTINGAFPASWFRTGFQKTLRG